MRDQVVFQVVETPHSITHHDGANVIGRRAAFEAAMKVGERFSVFRFDGRRRHWELIIDRSMPVAGQLPKEAHLSNVLRVVRLVPMKREVSGRRGYRWVEGYMVRAFPSGNPVYPPTSLNEARQYARECYGKDTIVIAD